LTFHKPTITVFSVLLLILTGFLIVIPSVIPALGSSTQDDSSFIDNTDSYFFLVLLMSSAAAVACFPISLLFLSSMRVKKVPDAIQIKEPLKDRIKDSDFLILSNSSPAKLLALWIWGVPIFLSPLLALILSPDELGWNYSRLILLGSSTGFAVFSLFKLITVKEPSLNEKITLMTFFGAITGVFVSFLLVPVSQVEYMVTTGNEWLESMMWTAVFLLGLSGAFFIISGFIWGVEGMDKRNRCLYVEKRSLFSEEFIEIPLDKIKRLVLRPGYKMKRNTETYLEFYHETGKKIVLRGGGVFSTELTNPHLLGVMFLKEGHVNQVEDKLPVWPFKKKTLTSDDVKKGILSREVLENSPNSLEGQLQDNWVIKRQSDSVILEMKEDIYQNNPKGMAYIAVIYGIIAVIGLGAVGFIILVPFILMTLGIELSEVLARNFPSLAATFLLGGALAYVGIYQLAQLVKVSNRQVKIVLGDSKLFTEMIPPGIQSPGSQFLYEQIEKIEAGKKRNDRFPVILSNFFIDLPLTFCKSNVEAVALSSFITREIQRIALSNSVKQESFCS